MKHVCYICNFQNNDSFHIKVIFIVGSRSIPCWGKNPYEFIKRNCIRLLTNELAEKYSWLGAKQKQKFCRLKHADLLIGKCLIYIM